MSSGPFTYALSGAAAFVLRSLMERPDLQTAEEIAQAPRAGEEIDAAAAGRALSELAGHGLTAEGPGGRWRLTDAGRGATQQA
jgi:hypothetical protein